MTDGTKHGLVGDGEDGVTGEIGEPVVVDLGAVVGNELDDGGIFLEAGEGNVGVTGDRGDLVDPETRGEESGDHVVAVADALKALRSVRALAEVGEVVFDERTNVEHLGIAV